MAAKIGQQRRLIQVSGQDLKAGRLCLRGHLGFFPSGSFGGRGTGEEIGKRLELDISGVSEVVHTDIPFNSETESPSVYFRDNSWVNQFYSANEISDGSIVAIEKTGRNKIRVETASDFEASLYVKSSEMRSKHDKDEPLPKKQISKLLVKWPKKAPTSECGFPGSPQIDGLDRIAGIYQEGFKFIDLFAGIGGIRLGFEHHGGECVFSSEWDQDAAKTYEANFGHSPQGDITQIEPETIPDHDVLLAGFPCQPFSIIGGQKGFGDTRGTLFFNVEEILRIKRPPVILLENVKQFKTHDKGRTYRTVMARLHELGYFTHTAILNAIHYGVPQKRERTFIVGFCADVPFRFPDPMTTPPSLDSVLEPEDQIDPKLIASDRIQIKRQARLKEQGKVPFYPSVWHENKGGNIGIHPFSCALRHNASYNYLLVNGRRRLSSRECLRLQGFPDSFKIVLKHSLIRAQTGNSVAVPVIKAIAEQMMQSIALAKEGKCNSQMGSLFETVVP